MKGQFAGTHRDESFECLRAELLLCLVVVDFRVCTFAYRLLLICRPDQPDVHDLHVLVDRPLLPGLCGR